MFEEIEAHSFIMFNFDCNCKQIKIEKVILLYDFLLLEHISIHTLMNVTFEGEDLFLQYSVAI